MRKSGILLPVSSLPSKYGIGAFSKDAYEFIDKLKEAGQSYWQILPLGPTGYGDSPYQSFSTFAGNPYFISLEAFINRGWLTKEECNECNFGGSEQYVDYDKQYEHRFRLLRKAFDNSAIVGDEIFKLFCEEEAYWLDDYALYREIKAFYGGKCWIEWEDKYRLRDKTALTEFSEENKDGILFQKFLQYEFWVQWSEIKKYANKNGIQIIGDIPIYVAFDGSDSWANPELFQFDKDGKPTGVAGCPPDAFSATGQLWGNPLYDWKYHKKTKYAWWIKRIQHCKKLYDVIRIDHFRGFDEYWAIPYGDTTAAGGKWEKGPGLDLFKAIEKKVKDLNIIAEDLGFLTPSVLQMLADSGYPGMKVLEFGFNSEEPSAYIPYNHIKNCVVYTGTHDNETLLGWYKNMTEEEQQGILDYIGRECEEEEVVWELIRMAQGSVADTCVIPMQDYLCLGNEARINHPSTLGANWKWRMTKEQFTEELAEKIKKMTVVYGRCKVEKKKVVEVTEIEKTEIVEDTAETVEKEA